MPDFKKRVEEAAAFIGNHCADQPIAGLLTGTGLGGCADAIQIAHTFDYDAIPHFPRPTVESHHGRLIIGRLGNCPVAAFQGRFHLYEGYSPQEVTFPVRILQKLGTRILLVTNAAGGLNPQQQAGEIMLIADHINLTGENPLVGVNDPEWGLRFPDMSQVYDPELMEYARSVARDLKLALSSGVYAGLKGPSLETPAELRFLRTIGADAVGLSTVQEVIAAVHAGLRILGLSVITNIADPDAPAPATLEEIIAVADEAAPRLKKLMIAIMEQLPANE
ncbi:MAG: purine-nucleoside phosphorylase [Desulfobacterales bacterium]|nr:purine-nucleoside phosphorylase [Desulfobacterales bacterium]MDJ0874013.1 purine-nucleoside phosphorylase [Desulfobacterales bacterium]MDJ0885638.1 purine-nucleoside phosphorylase [Desulfobacterales bacterium]